MLVRTKEPSRRRGWKRPVGLGLALALVVALAGGGWTGVRGLRAADDLTRAAALFQQLAAQLTAGDAGAAAATLSALQARTRAARERTGGAAWRLAGHVPAVGDELSAVATVAEVLDDLARRALPPLIETAGSVGSGALLPRGGRLQLPALRAATPRLAAADAVLRRDRDRIAAVPLRGLDARVRDRIEQLRGYLERAIAITGPLARAAALLPAMMGADGPRTYLVLFQNLAEVRATGGLPGAFVVLGADRGAISIIEQGTAFTTLGEFDRPVLPLPAAQRDLYTDRVGKVAGDANFTPYFPAAAATLREMYRLRSGRTVDGVLATDPVALSYVMAATGPIAVPRGGPLTARTAVRTLLSDAYATWRTDAEQDRYFAGVARAVFDRLTALDAEPRALLAALRRATGERRMLVWSAHPDEQRLITGTALEGALPPEDGPDPTVGVFLNDGTGGKLSYYLSPAASVSVGACRPDGRRELTVRVTLSSSAPSSGLPETVTGLAQAGPYVARSNVLVFAPTGGAIASAALDGAPAPMGTGVERGRMVGVVTLDVPPGGRRTVELTVLTRDTRTGPARIEPRLQTTPMARPWAITTGSTQRC
ncbi:DUF4012 domain-containing protein [Dactylosporangium sp. CA-092794]|uniref:DUF4012 domain-containing protein n=1 Tax=Dactylosporangium sp. CA-092794 TaxID=3239929 RepID=UPI003D8B8CCC